MASSTPATPVTRTCVRRRTDIAAKYRAEGWEKVIKNITTGPKVKLGDGTEEDHKIIETKDPKELKNLADWIMSRSGLCTLGNEGGRG